MTQDGYCSRVDHLTNNYNNEYEKHYCTCMTTVLGQSVLSFRAFLVGYGVRKIIILKLVILFVIDSATVLGNLKIKKIINIAIIFYRYELHNKGQ